jgi:hypothetical protein
MNTRSNDFRDLSLQAGPERDKRVSTESEYEDGLAYKRIYEAIKYAELILFRCATIHTKRHISGW